jgi:hypothetical protein
MSLQDLERGNGFALIDPHGDLVARIAKNAPYVPKPASAAAEEEAARIALNKQFEQAAESAKKPADLTYFDMVRNATFDEPGTNRDNSFGRELYHHRTGKRP